MDGNIEGINDGDDDCDAVGCLKPFAVWGYFDNLTQIPRPSGYMDDYEDEYIC